MNRTVLQVPVSADLRKAAEEEAINQGFSSLQEAVRIFMHKLADKTIRMTWQEKTIQLSAKNARRYEKMIDDIEKGRVKSKSFNNAHDLIEHLHS